MSLSSSTTVRAEDSVPSDVDALVGQVAQVIRDARSLVPHGPAIVAKFDHVDTAVIELQHALADLQEFVVLAATPVEHAAMLDAAAAWESLPSGVRSARPAGLVAASPTLSALSRAAITIEGVTRFSPDQLTLATKVGAHLAEYPHYAQALVGAHREFLVAPRAVEGMQQLLAWLASRSIATGFAVEYSSDRHPTPETAWKRLSGKPGAAPRNAHLFRVVLGEVAEEHRAFLGGHWLTAYAYWIAHDQFSRLDVPFEIYTNVEYSLAADLGGGKSDIDVLVRTPNLLLCIECKSGSLTMAHKGISAARKTSQSASRLEAVFERMELDVERSFQLLYMPRSGRDETAQIAEELAAGGAVPITTATPQTIRASVQELTRRA